MHPNPLSLPAGMTVLERGWLSANNIMCFDGDNATLIDSGYVAHAEQTVALVGNALQGRRLKNLINTHSHSDHIGGNAALQAAFNCEIMVPAGLHATIADWDQDALLLSPLGQQAARFQHDHLISAGCEIEMGELNWQALAVPGHDMEALAYYNPEKRILISGDALWENGFGVVFPEIEGIAAFDEVAATLNIIEQLQPAVVLPGHGSLFVDVGAALATARRRLEGFARSPERHARYAAKVLLKYKLLEWQQITLADLAGWAQATPYFGMLHRRHFAGQTESEWLQSLSDELVRSGAALRQGEVLHNL